ncbi:restriction endonuclease subunit S [Pseudomonas sp. B28(2017)]|uniref:restriction endonuclease subunit S n=1 Tax=Pseudomonas sp. B28(2017) TaxID=1981730 RepID=UPI001C45338A
MSDITDVPDQYIPQDDESFVYIDIGAIDRTAKVIQNPQRMLGKDAPNRARKKVAAGDTLVSMTRPNLNAVALVPEIFDGQIASTGFDVLRPRAGIDPRWLAYTVRTDAFVNAMSELVQGALYPAVRSKDVRSYVTPLAPEAEQKRIADQLDILLSRIQSCNERLDSIPAMLKRFRHTVLRAATTGDLTEEIRAERNWSSTWPAQPLTSLGEIGRGKSKHRPRNDPRLYGGVYPFVQTGDVAQSGGLITKHHQTYSEFGLLQSRLWPAGTLCITIAANIADTAILEYPACFPDSVVGFVANPSECLVEFVKWSIDVVKDDLEALAPATAQKNINLAVLKSVMISCPSLEEQTEIVRRAKELLSIADQIESRYGAAITLSRQLAPLTLAKAFLGELVPQDPTDEPASALLARIAATHAEVANSPKARQPRQSRPPRIPNKAAAMTKNRQDQDVMGQPYLAEHLLRMGAPASAGALFKVAELPVGDFYKQLAWEVAQGHVKENETMLEPNHAAG